MSGEGLPLQKRFTADIGAAFGAGFALSWLITPMDAAVTENMSGKTTMGKSLKSSFKEILTRPHRYLRRPEYGIIFGVYSMTYLAKNGTDSYCAFKNMSNEQTAFVKFWTVLAVNGSLCIFWRDPQFAKIFATKPPSAVPALSYALWALRDVVHTMGAVVAPDYVEKRYSLTPEQWGYCQLSFPLIIQTLTTPCHLIGLDFYNFKESTFGARIGRTASQYVPSVAVRCVRMFPPWSIGLLANRKIRNYIMEGMDK
eukprot:536011_1